MGEFERVGRAIDDCRAARGNCVPPDDRNNPLLAANLIYFSRFARRVFLKFSARRRGGGSWKVCRSDAASAAILGIVNHHQPE
jgi:hypothetical protein